MDKQAEAATKGAERAPILVGQPPPYSQGYQQQPTVVQPIFIQQPVSLSQPQPPDYLALSIFTIFCCFWPLGVFALVKSLETRSSYQYGRYQDSVNASRSSLMFNRLSILVGFLIWFVVALFQLAWIIPVIVAASTADNTED